MRLFQGDRIAMVMTKLKVPEGEPIQSPLVTKSVENAQKKVESNNFSTRKRLLEYDNVMNQQREVIYARRRHALMGERLKSEVLEYVEEFASDLFDTYFEEKNAQAFANELRTALLLDPHITDADMSSKPKSAIINEVMALANEFYERKEESLSSTFMASLERYAFLQTIDEQWREHLRGMDDLKEGIYLRAYGQKDPLLEYKQEAYKAFLELIKEINKSTAQVAFKYFPRVVERTADAPKARPTEAPQVRSTVSASRSLQFSHATPTSSFSGGTVQQGATESPAQTVKHEARTFGRNEPCPIEPGKKFKNCCGAAGHRTCVKLNQ